MAELEYSIDLKKDLVTQFTDQPNISALVEVIQKQFADVCDFYAQLKVRRWLDLAEGIQLDRIGDIVCLTRGEAGYLACIDQSVEVLPDDEYRKYLIFKIWKNTNNCTYYDVLKAFKMFWPSPLYYSEDPSQPATMLFETKVLKPGEMDVQKLFNAPIIRAAGVGIYIRAITEADPVTSELYVLSHIGRGLSITPIPEYQPEWNFRQDLYLSSAMARWMQTVILNDETTFGLVVKEFPEDLRLEIWGYLRMLGYEPLSSSGNEETQTINITETGLTVVPDNKRHAIKITGG